MALVDCSLLWQKISEKHKTVQYCEFAIGQAVFEDLATPKFLKKIPSNPKVYKNQSMLAMLLFVGDFGLNCIGAVVTQKTLQFKLAFCGAVIGLCWYIVNRVRIVILKIRLNGNRK